MGMMPGMGGMKDKAAAAGLDDKVFDRQLAIIGSMTKAERANPDLLKHSRKQRIAKGSGTNAADINKLLKMHRQMADMMKVMGKGKGGMMKQMMGGLASKMGLGGLGAVWAACPICRRWIRSSLRRSPSRRKQPVSPRVECRAFPAVDCPAWADPSFLDLVAAFPVFRRRSEHHERRTEHCTG